MSLAITLANQYGIVMSADRRLTTTVTDEKTNEKESFVLTEYEQKIFLTNSGHGITYTGASSFKNGEKTSCIIRNFLVGLAPTLSIEEELLSVKERLKSIAGERNVILLGAAIDSRNIRRVFATSLISAELTDHISTNGSCLSFSGESDTLKKLTDMFPVNYSAFPLQESINYLRFLTRSVAGLQHYAQINQTVSEDCDILVLRDSGAQWITSPEILR
ncbi:MAG: hypothetical protein KH706_07520 [Faecalibacterium prausnitzii]|nr:hypothetical protein [Faecalibacterium prausnitzii]